MYNTIVDIIIKCCLKKLILNFLFIIVVISCSSIDKSEVEEINVSVFKIDSLNGPKESKSQVINDFYEYIRALKDLNKNDYISTLNFLSSQKHPNSMNEILRLKLLKNLGDNNNAILFLTEFANLPEEALNEEISCYHYLYDFNNSDEAINKVKQLADSNENMSTGCMRLYNYGAVNGLISTDDVWKRIWILLYYNKVSSARFLAKIINDPLPDKLGSFKKGTNGDKVGLMYLVISPKNRNKSNVDSTLNKIADKLNPDQLLFVHGVLGISNAKDLNINKALFHYRQASEKYMSNEHWEWLARSYLRISDWNRLNKIIDMMPNKISNTPVWTYWKAKSIEHIEHNKNNLSVHLYNQVSNSGRNFYATLATQELGKNINVKDNVPKVNNNDIKKISQDVAIDRALILLNESKVLGDVEMRIAAQDQWKYAVRRYNEDILIVAGQLAYENNFYEMAIYSAEKTNKKLNFSLRYISVYTDIINRYSNMYGINNSWVMGIIRQESRFIPVAKSSVGAVGLMQLMPSTARFIANKIGLDYSDIYNVDTNINMGIWYLSYLFDNVGSYVLATAGYNAGKSNAKKWQEHQPLDGAIYVETIPFKETRNYVKQVMTNSIYYANLFSSNNKSLKSLLGIIPGKQQ